MSDSTKSARASDASSTGQAAIEIRGLLKEYGNHKAVNNVSFSVKQGEILGFLGPNGAGKTTTMRMITGYLSPTKGAVYVNGRNVFDYPLWVKRQIGYLPETPPLYMEMTTHAYLELVANLKGIPHRHIRDEIASVVAR
ncbi:MAG: ABC transporter ATP-binding protein, partial [Planctomycetes bacterium]|nr:ABC transporter ATP-binding protein [Planctomycetota bacterium]